MVLLQTDNMLAGLINMETGERGFLLAGTDDFLEPYRDGQKIFSAALAEILQLTSDNSTRQDQLKRLGAVMQDWDAKVLQPEIALRREASAGTKSMDDVVKVTQAANGKSRMDGMRKMIAEVASLRVRANKDAALPWSPMRCANWPKGP